MAKDKDKPKTVRRYDVTNKSGQSTTIKQYSDGSASYERSRDTPRGEKTEIWKKPGKPG